MFAPKYLKNARDVVKNVTRLLHYKRDLLRPEDFVRLTEKNQALADSIRQRDQGTVERLIGELDGELGKVIPTQNFPGIRENCETLLVAIVIALGIRAYFLQPFKIPTGSMQPTVNGVIATPLSSPLPSLPQRFWEVVWNGRSYLEVVAKRDDTVAQLQAVPFLWFSVATQIVTTSGLTYKIKCPPANLMNDLGVGPGTTLRAGQPIVRARVQTGDQLFVDKFTYHFRKPVRGEVFVFTTQEIPGILNDPRSNGLTQFYIKRLAAIPGDQVRIAHPDLFINNEIAAEFGLKRVMSNQNGYRGFANIGTELLQSPLQTFDVPAARYLALGDNSYNSSDSRFWGTVPERSVVGRGFFVYWPFGQNFGIIR